MLKFSKGVLVNCADKLSEGFEVSDCNIIANVDEDKTLNLIKKFVINQRDPLFLILEVPSNYKDEINKNKMHKDIYYADGLSNSDVLNVLDEFGYLFVNDGMGQIGVGNHVNKSEIMTAKYNVVTIHSKKCDIKEYEEMFVDSGIERVDNLITAWDYFDKSSHGVCETIECDGKTIYDVVTILKEKIGLYFFEQREDF